MAFLIPENLRTRADVPPGTARLARVLQEALEDSATVWYEPLFDPRGHRPHLAVLVPDSGILVLEVFGAKAGTVKGVRGDRLLVSDADGGSRELEDPLGRARGFAATLETALGAEARLGADERLPVAAAGVFAYLGRDEAASKGLGGAIDLDRCLFRDALETGLVEPSRIRRRFLELLGGPLRDPLSPVAERAHRAVIHPDTVIGRPTLPFPSATPAEELKVLDRAQEVLAKGLGEGHRVVRGVAGSGKTLVLSYRARLFADAFPGHRILVTCFNQSLAGMLKRQLPMPNVDVKTIDHVIRDVHDAAHEPVPSYKETELEGRADAALALVDQPGTKLRMYDHVLVDEAQDFPTPALKLTVAMLREGSDSLLVVADAAQNIYRNKFTWKAAGINASGRTRVLDLSYRNTVEILTYAHGFLMKGGSVELDDGTGTSDEGAVIPPRTNRRHGPPPTFLHMPSPQAEVVAITEKCRKLVEGGVSPGAIGVLYGAKNAVGFPWPQSLARRFVDLGVPFFWVTDPDQVGNKRLLGADPGKVVLSTIHSAKGFEFVHVFLCGYLDDKPEETKVLNRRLIYVGMTRATNELVLTASGDHPYIADLEA